MALARLILLCSLALLMGCTFNHTMNTTRAVLTDVQLLEQRHLHSGRDWVAPRNSAWFVALPNRGPSQAVDQALTQHLAAAMRQHFATVVVGDKATAPDKAVRQARYNGVNFVIYPQLLFEGDGAYSVQEWLNGEPEQAFGRDQTGVQLLVFDAFTGQLLDAVTLTVKESWLPGYNTRVDQLYASAFESFAQQFSYQPTEQPR
ncbi:DUF4823 domain-containing protein [Simiduia sp. 21SJ11W-1]|uniref:DUF4823 domain-containing protein n=1 Tax=Simiduia sp. 21SJ11W-1 TaxID=2909669 RepID=UPI00209F0FEA|nr:DUF4823 domain-containing protein [Simiduia sp. 21SJ11W-1]UTA46386.1 DUF4823 domain-containing protein [Simiduia sp. 21SJ11W-1]